MNKFITADPSKTGSLGRIAKRAVTAAVSASIGLAIGMTGIAGAEAKPSKPTFTKSQMYRCAGAVMEADAVINGGDKSLRKSFNRKRNACAKVVGGF